MRLRSLLHAALISAAHAFECSISFFSENLSSTSRVTSVLNLPANSTFHVPVVDVGFPLSPTGLPALCVVQVEVNEITDAPYGFAIFLPYDWNRRSLTVGGSGYAGGIDWVDMGAGVKYGFATLSTDYGHEGNSSDGTWAYNQPEKQSNWGWRAIHGSTVIGGKLIESFYGNKIAYRYFSGCSTGGRQGFKSAEMFPDDFDGILAGSPIWWEDRQPIHTGYMGLQNLPVDAPYHIDDSMFSVIADEAVKQCDPQDGLKDGIIAEPTRCDFRPETLLCGPGVTNSTASKCLTSAQLSTLYKWYSNWVEGNQTFIYPHFVFGSEEQWTAIIGGSAPNAMFLNWIQYFIGLGPNWKWQDWNPEIVELSSRLNPGNATANNFDLSPFHDSGGKLLHYHGYSDGLHPATSSVYLYEHIYRTMRPLGIELDDWYRLFFVPGMQHCLGTPSNQNAPWYFAGATQAASLNSGLYSVPGFSDAKHDILLALVDWVENGNAPTQIIATKWRNDTLQDSVYRQRPLCAYPKHAKYRGFGDPDRPENWECVALY